MTKLRPMLAAAVALTLAASGGAQDERPADSAIAWYGTWEQGLRVAKASARPILLLSAAPQCHGTPGLW